MILRNGIRSTLRARGRTGLFTVLLFVLTLTLTLGLGMWNYCAGTLADMDENYTSIALVEYMGEDYPEENAAVLADGGGVSVFCFRVTRHDEDAA